MKITFDLPVTTVQRLRSHVPSGKRSKFVDDLISRKLARKRTALEDAALKANTLIKVNKEMADWEALNEHDHQEG